MYILLGIITAFVIFNTCLNRKGRGHIKNNNNNNHKTINNLWHDPEIQDKLAGKDLLTK